MIPLRVLALFAVLLLAGPTPAKPAELPLAADGKALVPVVVSEKASPATKQVAAELAGYLGRVTGAKFEVVAGDGTKGIVLGTLAEFPNPALAKELAIRDTFDGREAFAVRTEPTRVLLVGATDLGASHAAFRFLESLGGRWYFPAREWEVIPTQKNLTASVEETDRRKILARRIWYGYGFFTDNGHPTKGANAKADYEAWARHNRMATSFRVHAGHQWQNIIASNKKLFEDHPEYLTLVKGERKGEQLCVSNPAVRKLASEHTLGWLAKNPDAEKVSMECSDGGGQCHVSCRVY